MSTDKCAPRAACPPARGSLLASGLYDFQTCAYCRLSPAWKLAEDPLPRLALLLVRQQALLVYRVPWDIHPHAQTALLLGLARTPVIVAADIRIAVAQTLFILFSSLAVRPCDTPPTDITPLVARCTLSLPVFALDSILDSPLDLISDLCLDSRLYTSYCRCKIFCLRFRFLAIK
jgi:hypothetical protein